MGHRASVLDDSLYPLTGDAVSGSLSTLFKFPGTGKHGERRMHSMCHSTNNVQWRSINADPTAVID
jgi:hypothetical protein